MLAHLTATRLRGYVHVMARTAFAVLLMVFLLGIAACGDDDRDEGTTTAAKSDEAQPAKVNLERFLMRAGEEPGFEPVEEPRTEHGVQSLPPAGIPPTRWSGCAAQGSYR